MSRLVSHLQLKALDGEQRILEGWASKPECDRSGDIVESRGAAYKLPLPLLMDHDHKSAVGEVYEASVSDAGIRFKAKIAKIDEPGAIKDLCDSAWSAAKAGLRRAVSIGFRALDMEPISGGGWRFKEWEWYELSLVSVPACAGASIDQIKTIDRTLRKNEKYGNGRVVRLSDPVRGGVGDRPFAKASLSSARDNPASDLATLTGQQLATFARTGDEVYSEIRQRLDRLEGGR